MGMYICRSQIPHAQLLDILIHCHIWFGDIPNYRLSLGFDSAIYSADSTCPAWSAGQDLRIQAKVKSDDLFIWLRNGDAFFPFDTSMARWVPKFGRYSEMMLMGIGPWPEIFWRSCGRRYCYIHLIAWIWAEWAWRAIVIAFGGLRCRYWGKVMAFEK
jgi:hypothetical protein